MRIVFQGDNSTQTVWNISMISDEEERAAMRWLKENKAYAEGITSGIQLTRLLLKYLGQAK